MSFYDRYITCCHLKGIQPCSQASADQLGCRTSNISALGKSGTTPRGDIVAGAAMMLDVSADYLLGLIDNPCPINNAPRELDYKMLTLFHNLNDKGQKVVLAVMKGLVLQEEYKLSKGDG